MTSTTHEVLVGFDSLSPSEKHAVAVEILRRAAGPEDIPSAAFDELAAELFSMYDAEEEKRGSP